MTFQMTASSRSCRANETYSVGRLSRSSVGYEWREDPPAGRTGTGPWLVPKAEDCEILYPPPRGSGFLRQFTLLRESDPDGLVNFADRYGSLGAAEGEPLALWAEQTAAVRDLLQTVEDADLAAPPENRYEFREPLRGHFVHPYGVGRSAASSVSYRYGPWPLTFSLEVAQALGFRELDGVSGDALVDATAAMGRFARICVQQAIERRLQGAHVGVRYELLKRGPQPPRLVPTSLLGAIYLAVDARLRGSRRPLQVCAWGPCSTLFEPTKVGHLYCSNTCVVRRRRATRREGTV